MFIYENGLVTDYAPSGRYPENIEQELRRKMVAWANSLGGQSRVRLGKIGIMEGSEVNLKRMENE